LGFPQGIGGHSHAHVAGKLGGKLHQRIIGLISNVTALGILNALERIIAALIESSVLDAHELQSLLADVRDCSEELTRGFFTNVLQAGSDPKVAAAHNALMERPDEVAEGSERLKRC
jgi:hypothetical protein